MASEPTFVGEVYIFGLDGTLAYSGMATTGNEPQRAGYQDEISRHDSKDKKGATVGVQLFNPNPKITITFMPKADATGGGAIADAKSNMVLPAKGSKVTLSGFPPVVATAEDTINSTKWLYLGGGSIDFTNDQEVVMTLPLEKFATDLAVNNT